MGRIRTLLLRDADDVFEQLAIAQRGFFKRHPWGAHALWLLCLAVVYTAVWFVGSGLRTVLALLAVSVILILVMVVTTLAWVRFRRRR